METDIHVTPDQFETLTKRVDGQRYLHKVTDLLKEIERIKHEDCCPRCGGQGGWVESVYGWGGYEQTQCWCDECMGTGSFIQMERLRSWLLSERIVALMEALREVQVEARRILLDDYPMSTSGSPSTPTLQAEAKVVNYLDKLATIHDKFANPKKKSV